jgi:two-component system CheB/CheR fusion protein
MKGSPKPTKKSKDFARPLLPMETHARRSLVEKHVSSVSEETFRIVGVGASAGGLEAFTEFLEGLAADTGMAFVLVQHLEAKHESVLTKLLSKATQMRVTEVRERTRVEPNHIYVIPPNGDLSLADGVLQILRPKAGNHLRIDHFFRALARAQGSHAVGVVLSGTASDGTLGLRAIKVAGGITFAQVPESAKFDGCRRARF